MRRALLDSGAYDTLIDVPGAYETALRAVQEGRFEILYTQVNLDELAATNDLDQRRRLLYAMVSLGRLVPLGAFALGFHRRPDGSDLRGARLDCAQLASDHEAVLIDSLRAGNLRYTSDELLAATARFENCAFVIRGDVGEGDKRIMKRKDERGVEILTTMQLLAEMGFREGDRQAAGP